MFSSSRTESPANARHLLRKHLGKGYAINLPNTRYLEQSDSNLNGQWTNCSIVGSQDNQSKDVKKVNSPFKRGYRGMNSQLVTNSSIPDRTKQTIEDANGSQKGSFRRNFNLKGNPKESRQQINITTKKEGVYAKQVRNIMVDFIDKLFAKKNGRSLNSSMINRSDFQSKHSSSPHSNLSGTYTPTVSEKAQSPKITQSKLISLQNKATYFVQQLQNIKNLWEKSNSLRRQLMKCGDSFQQQKNTFQQQSEIIKYQDSHTTDKTVAFNEFKEFMRDLNKEEVEKSLGQLQTFERNIANHLEDLKERFSRIEDVAQSNVVLDLKNKQFELTEIIDHLRKRNKELEFDNITILKENEKIHEKFCELQTSYKHKTNRLLNEIKQLRRESCAPRIIEEESQSSQQEIMNLKEELTSLSHQNIKILHQMSIMKSQLDVLEEQKNELSDLVESYEIREHESLLMNTRIVGELKEKISSLEKEFGKIEDGHKRTSVTTVNHSLAIIEERLPQMSSERSIVVGGLSSESLIVENEGVFDVLRMNILERENKELKSVVEKQKIKWGLKGEEDQCPPLYTSDEKVTPESILSMLGSYLNTHSVYNPDQKSKIVTFVQKALHSKSLQHSVLQLTSIVRKQASNSRLSVASDDHSSTSQPQPTYMDVFSKFDQRQQSIFRLIDYIGSNLKAGDLLTEIVNQFVMKVIPEKQFQEYQAVAEEFLLKIADYQFGKARVIDKVISNYINITQGIFLKKEEIEAVLDESSDDEEELDKCLWEDILYPQSKVKELKVRTPEKRRRKPILMPSIKQLVELHIDEPLPVIKQQRKHPNNLSLFSQDSDSSYYSNNTPIKAIIDEQN